MLLLMSSQYPSEIHPELHPGVVVWPVVPVVVVITVVPVVPVVAGVVVVPVEVVVEFPPLPPLGSRHEHSIQY
jgi:hypothetical protein